MRGAAPVLLVVGALIALSTPRALRRQAALARRRIGKPLGEQVQDANRVWRRREHGDPLDLVVLGDSIAAGLGAERPKDTLGARVAKGLGAAVTRPVRLQSVAVVGSESSDLPSQIAHLPRDLCPQLALIIVGGNDVTHRVPKDVSLGHLGDAVRVLRGRGGGSSWGPAPTSERSARCLSRCGRCSRGCRVGSRSLRHASRAAKARGRCPCATPSDACSPRSPTGCSAPTGSTRAPRGTEAPPGRSCPRWPRNGRLDLDARGPPLVG